MYPILMSFVLKEGTEERFMEAVRIMKEAAPRFPELIYIDSFKSLKPRFEAPYTQTHVIAHAWNTEEGFIKFVTDEKLKAAAFSIFDEIKVSHDIVHYESL